MLRGYIRLSSPIGKTQSLTSELYEIIVSSIPPLDVIGRPPDIPRLIVSIYIYAIQ